MESANRLGSFRGLWEREGGGRALHDKLADSLMKTEITDGD